MVVLDLAFALCILWVEQLAPDSPLRLQCNKKDASAVLLALDDSCSGVSLRLVSVDLRMM